MATTIGKRSSKSVSVKSVSSASEFGDTAIAVHEGMAALGRSTGIKIDPKKRQAIIQSQGEPMVLDLDNPSNREKVTFALRIAPVFYRKHAATGIEYEVKASKSGASARYLDAAIHLRSDPEKLAGCFEIKVAAGADPWPEIEAALAQMQDYLARLISQGKMAPLASISIVVFAQGKLQDPSWSAADYINAQGGPGSIKPKAGAANLRSACKEQFEAHGMVCMTWIVDLSEKDKVEKTLEAALSKSLLEKTAPTSMTLPWIGEIEMKGQTMMMEKGQAVIKPASLIIAKGETALLMSADADAIGKAPTFNPSGASLLQNTRNFAKGPVEKPGAARSAVVIENIKAKNAKGLSEEEIEELAGGYEGCQTGANARRLMAMRDETLWRVISGQDETSLLLMISTNVSLSDSQSSTACFASMSAALQRSETYEDYVDNLTEELRFYGIMDPEFPKKLKAKLFEGCEGQPQKSARFKAFKTVTLSAVFDLKIEFPETQEQATQSSQAANQVYPQSTVDLSLASQRASAQRLLNEGERWAKKEGWGFPFALPKQAEIEERSLYPISELAQVQYMGAAANPEVWGGARLKLSPKVMDSASAGATLKGAKLIQGAGAKDETAIEQAARKAEAARQTLNRAHFEGASEPKRLAEEISAMMPCASKVAAIAQPVVDEFMEGLESSGVRSAIERGRLALSRQRNSRKKQSGRLTEAQKAVADELLNEVEKRVLLMAEQGDCDERFLRTLMDKVWPQLLAEASQKLGGDTPLRAGLLVEITRALSPKMKAALAPWADFSEVALARMIMGSMQCSWPDACLNKKIKVKEWKEILMSRARLAAEALQEKLSHVGQLGLLTTERVKMVGRGRDEALGFHKGELVAALPKEWRSKQPDGLGGQVEVHPAYQSGALWLLHAGLTVEGAWRQEAIEMGVEKVRILMSAN